MRIASIFEQHGPSYVGRFPNYEARLGLLGGVVAVLVGVGFVTALVCLALLQ